MNYLNMAIFLDNPSYDEFKKLSKMRIKEAKILFKKFEYSGAYYLAGYSIELALKACYCKNVKEQSFPPKKEIYYALYSHDLNNLLDVSGIKLDFEKREKKDKIFQENWITVKDWTEQSRYGFFNRTYAESLINSIVGQSGILNWIKKLW